jgi:hypothetical protein
MHRTAVRSHSTCVYVCVYMYVCIYMCICMYVYMYVCIHVMYTYENRAMLDRVMLDSAKFDARRLSRV